MLMTTKKILITGGLGYIGSKFLQRFNAEYNFKIVDSNFFGNHLPTNQYDSLLLKDIRDLNLNDLDGVEYVLHLAELSNDPLGNINSKLTHDINVLGTKKLIDLCNQSNIRNFIYMSSCSVYGKTQDKYVDELSALTPLTDYSKSKILNEKYILENNRNFPITIFRNATVFGFAPNLRLDLAINDLTYSAFSQNKIKVLSDGTPKRPFVHIDDLVTLIHHLFSNGIYFDNEIINIGNEELNYSIKEVANQISEITGVSEISFGNADTDQRSYLVKFDKIRKLMPDFTFKNNLKLGVLDLLKNFEHYEHSFSSRRLSQIEQLKKEDKIDDNLRWII